jgi:hypothetical protein
MESEAAKLSHWPPNARERIPVEPQISSPRETPGAMHVHSLALPVGMGLHPNRTPEEARRTGRYVLENDEHVDVRVARAATAVTGEKLSFDDAWSRRQTVRCGEADVALPNIDDLITTKRWSMRAKDVLDIQLIEALRRTPT